MWGDRVLAHNLVVGSGTLAAGFLGVAFQSLASHQLRPEDYGGVFTAVTLMTFIGLPASAFTLLMARTTSRGRASGHLAESAALLRRANRSLLVLGLCLGVTMAICSPLVARFLDVSVPLLLATAAGLPFTLAMPLLLGELQGEERFVIYALLSTGQAGLKLAAAIGLGVVFGPVGVVAGISFASVVAYAFAFHSVRRKLSTRTNLPWLKPAARYLAVVLPSTLALAMLLSSDVLLVKHYFPTDAAGNYSAVAAIGRAIFWGASGIAVVLFPKVTFRGAKGGSGIQIVIASLGLVALGGVLGIVVLSAGSAWLLRAFAGSAYLGGAIYLPWYGLGMMLLGAVAVLTAAHQSRGTPGFLAFLLPLAVLEPLLVIAFHTTLLQVVEVVDISMAAVAAALAIWYLIQERLESAALVAVHGIVSDVQAVPQLQVNR